MPAFVPAPEPARTRPTTAAVRFDVSRPVALRAATTLAIVAALLACGYLHGEVVTLRAEVRASRTAALAAERAADRASLDAEHARTALANALPADPSDASQDGDSNR